MLRSTPYIRLAIGTRWRRCYVTTQSELLPVLDVNYLLGTATTSQREQCSTALIEAATSKLAFFYVTQPWEVQATLEALHQRAHSFFKDVPLDIKQTLAKESGGFGGYLPLGGELSTQDGVVTANMCEALDITLRGPIGSKAFLSSPASSINWQACPELQILQGLVATCWHQCAHQKVNSERWYYTIWPASAFREEKRTHQTRLPQHISQANYTAYSSQSAEPAE